MRSFLQHLSHSPDNLDPRPWFWLNYITFRLASLNVTFSKVPQCEVSCNTHIAKTTFKQIGTVRSNTYISTLETCSRALWRKLFIVKCRTVGVESAMLCFDMTLSITVRYFYIQDEHTAARILNLTNDGGPRHDTHSRDSRRGELP